MAPGERPVNVLSGYAHDVYSQFGDDGMIAEVFRRIGAEAKTCVEFGAHDGESCSNTANLRKHHGWSSLLIEPDAERFEALKETIKAETQADGQRIVAVQSAVTGYNIDALLKDHGFEAPDLMSIDVDGDDWFIFQGMHARPRLIVIEFNCSIPPHLDVRQAQPGGVFGASILSTLRLAHAKGYGLIGLNHTNAYLVPEPIPEPLTWFERDHEVLMAHRTWATIVSDYQGRSLVLDESSSLVWGYSGVLRPAPDEIARSQDAPRRR